MPAPIRVTHFSDPGCPWAYSAWPALTTLQWRYGDQLDWELVAIGLAESPERYEKLGYTPARQALGYVGFRRHGMPFSVTPRERVTATGLACRAVVATRLTAPEHEIAAFRALQFAHFCSTGLFDTDEGVVNALTAVGGLDVDAVLDAIGSDATEAAYQDDRARTRTAAGTPSAFQGRTANSDGAERYTAPSLVFTRASDDFVLECGGFQPVEAYDACVANLDVSLGRREPATDAVEVLAAFGHALTTAEVAAVMAPHLVAHDRAAAERSLIEAVGDGRAVRRAVGDDALWSVD